MPTIDITLRLLTPLYAGGAQRNVAEGLRPPALRGLLRFWWRTLHGTLPAAALRARESALFGSTDPRLGQRLRLRPRHWPAWACDPAGTQETDDVHRYLARGMVHQDRIRVARVRANETLALTLTWKNPQMERELRQTLWLLSAFGGSGARSRRGWGSLAIDGTEVYDETLPDPRSGSDSAAVARLLAIGLAGCLPWWRDRASDPAAVRPAYSAFSNRSRVLVGPQCSTADAALREIYTVYWTFRRALGAYQGHNAGQVGPDHVIRSGWLAAPASAGDRLPAGAAFGLPNDAYFTRTKKRLAVGVGPKLAGRRASPVFFKVLRCGQPPGTGYVPIVLWLPARFLPSSLAPHIGSPLVECGAHGYAAKGQCPVHGLVEVRGPQPRCPEQIRPRKPCGKRLTCATRGCDQNVRAVIRRVRAPGEHAIRHFFDGDPTLVEDWSTPASWPGLGARGWLEVP